MNKFALVSASVACAVALAPAAQATTFHIGDPNFQITQGTPFTPTISAVFFNSYGTALNFDDSFEFTIPQNGVGSGSLSTSFSSDSNKLIIDDLLINGVSYPLTSAPAGQAAEVGGIPITLGALNTIRVIGRSIGDGGTYSGTATFTASAVPEPATWAFMVAGFAALGAAIRRKRFTTVSFS
ncbi:MAG TPA: FxDxF family PEP-CTERM protein [Sphingobium sp.]|nr:FxDxF family PEP-CTERM protein [Sphingobium sp.]